MKELYNSAVSRDQEFEQQIMQKNIEAQVLKVQAESKSSLSKVDLKSQLELYKERYEDFKSSYEQSSEHFQILNKEIDKMQNLIDQEQDYHNSNKQKADNYDVQVLQLFQQNETLKEEISQLEKQKHSLKQECNSLLAASKK